MKRLLPILLLMICTPAVAQQQQLPMYPEDSDDPNFQRAGYELVVEYGIAEAIRPTRQWAREVVNDEVSADINNRYNNLTLDEIWGGSAVTGYIDTRYTYYPPTWYYVEVYRYWFYKAIPSGGGGAPIGPWN